MNEIYVVGNARTNLDKPITKSYAKFFLAFVIDEKTDEILEFEMSSIFEVTNNFVKKLFIGRNFIEDEEKIIEDIKKRYLGSSQKSIIVAYKDAMKKYNNSRN